MKQFHAWLDLKLAAVIPLLIQHLQIVLLVQPQLVNM